jgi:hypothetical protein
VYDFIVLKLQQAVSKRIGLGEMESTTLTNSSQTKHVPKPFCANSSYDLSSCVSSDHLPVNKGKCTKHITG